MVQGLKTFIRNEVSNAQKIIAIEQIIEEWKCVNHGTTPIIVIDFIGFCHELYYKHYLDLLFCNYDNLINIIEIVFSRFKTMGVRLEIFYRGDSKYIKNGELCSKRIYRPIQNTNRLFNVIKRETSTETVINQVPYIYKSNNYLNNAIMLAEKYGTVHKSYQNCVNHDIAMYASKHQAVAVMSWDYEFVLINNKFHQVDGKEGQWNFWDLKSFNPNTFKISQIDKIKVQHYLGLNDNEFSIFGALTKDNYQDGLIYNFLKRQGDKKYRFKNVAKLVKDKLCDSGLVVQVEIATILSPNNKDKNIRIAEKNISMFANLNEPNQFYEDELSSVTKRIQNSFVYEYINDLHVAVHTSHWRKTAYTKYIDCVIAILRRQMGVVLKDNKVGKHSRSVICIDHEGIKIKVVEPEYPLLDVPSLLWLYDKTKDKSLRETKLQLLCWIISDQLNYTTIENIEKRYLCAILTLVYTVQNQFISSEEADCILYCLLENRTNPQSINSLKHPDSITDQPLQLVFLYSMFYQFMIISMNTVGLSDLLTPNELNGIYVHKQFEQFINYPAEKRNNLLKMINGYRLYLNK